ncbi:capsid assembly scaffolding protein Gp46 family protein [Lacticaseibacillus salsurivasis]|uniref:capsid assembly scaffolding protein Gp46 family protein n=1 Tax=Lacticaseibacillus salsurivasis TaxID=3081441 RepID=UPI0030C6FA8E
MSEFTPIESQEELDKILGARLARQKETLEAKFVDYDELKSKAATLETENSTLKEAAEKAKAASDTTEATIAGLNKQVAGLQTASMRTKIALKNGLPYDLADRLVGDDEKSIQADAERLSEFVGKKPSTPLKDPDMGTKTGGNTAYQSLIEGLKIEGE